MKQMAIIAKQASKQDLCPESVLFTILNHIEILRKANKINYVLCFVLQNFFRKTAVEKCQMEVIEFGEDVITTSSIKICTSTDTGPRSQR